jgi:hypothetical protein
MKSGNIELTGTIKIGHFTTTQRNALTPEFGTEIYNTDSNVIEYWNGTQWSVNVYNVTGSGGITINTSAPGFINVNGTGVIGVLSAGSGISLTNNVISSLLSAGSGISLTNNVITNTVPGVTYTDGDGINIIQNEFGNFICVDTAFTDNLYVPKVKYISTRTFGSGATTVPIYGDNTYVWISSAGSNILLQNSMAVGESTVITFRPNTLASTVSWYDAFGDYVTGSVGANSTAVFNCTGVTTGVGGRMIVNFDIMTTH